MSAASSLEVNSVVPSLCWDSGWPPRWTVSAHILAGQAVCAELHTSPYNLLWYRPLSPHTSVPPVFLWLPSLSYQETSYIASPLPVTLQHCVCALLQGSHLPWHPHLCCHHLFCGVTLASAWRQEMQDASGCSFTHKRRNDGVISHPPTMLAPLPFRSRFRIALYGFVLGYFVGCVSLYYHHCSVCLSNTCLLPVRSLFLCSFLPSGIATWSTLVSFYLNIWNTILLPMP